MLRYIISIYLFSGVVLTSFLTTYVLSKSRNSYMKVFSAMSFCINLYLFGYLLEINSSVLEDMIFWNQIQYFGIPFFPVLWLLMALLYTKRTNILGKRVIIILSIIPLLTFFIRLTNSVHNLYYSGYEIRVIYELSLMYFKKGPWYYIHAIYLITTMIITTVILFNKHKKSIGLERSQFFVLFIASIVPYIGLLFNIVNYSNLGIDYTALLLPFSLILTMIAIYRFDFLEIKNLARETIFDNNTDGMILLDNYLKIMDYNKAAREIFHLDVSVQNKRLVEFLSNRKELIELFKSGIIEEFQLKQKDEVRFYEISSTVMRSLHGKMIGILKTVRDITDKRMLEEKLKKMATTDELSGLNNRRKFMKDAQIEFEHAKRYKSCFSVLMMDIDNFKRINDTFGHAAGDAVIHEFGKLIGKNFRISDIYGRIGGEEFCVILQNTSIDKALLIAENFRELVNNLEISYDDIVINLTVSIGISSFFTEARNIAEILKYADKAMYESKGKGKNCINLKRHNDEK